MLRKTWIIVHRCLRVVVMPVLTFVFVLLLLTVPSNEREADAWREEDT
jgi:hypothetical protein